MSVPLCASDVSALNWADPPVRRNPLNMPDPQTEPEPQVDPRSRVSGSPVHPLAALLLLVVDNLWNLGDWAVFAWIVIIPLSFLSVFFPGLLLQRYANRDTWGGAFGKGMLLGVLAAVPTSIAGTPIGVAFLTWAGVDKWRSRDKGIIDVETFSSTDVSAIAEPAGSAQKSSFDEGGNNLAIGSSPPLSQVHPTPHYFLPPPQKASRGGVLAVCALLIILCFGSGILLLKYASDTIESLADKFTRIPGLFRRPPIAEAFSASLPEFSRTVGGKLEIASFKITESFVQTDFEDFIIPLGQTKSEIRVPVTYTYHIKLHDPWNLRVTNGICIALAPAVRHGVPAIHTGGMVKKVQADFLTRLKPGADPQKRLDEFERSLTAKLWVNAGNPKYQAMVREEGRKTVGEFVRDWILKENRWKKYDIKTLRILFPDELNSPDVESLPTLIINKD